MKETVCYWWWGLVKIIIITIIIIIIIIDTRITDSSKSFWEQRFNPETILGPSSGDKEMTTVNGNLSTEMWSYRSLRVKLAKHAYAE